MTDAEILDLIKEIPLAKFGPITQLSLGIRGHLRCKMLDGIDKLPQRRFFIELRDYIHIPKDILLGLHRGLKND